jgi:hypothetical protein
MHEDVADVNDPPPVLDHRDEPVLVSADVENRENIHCIGVRKVGADIDQMSPGGPLGYAVPVQQRFHRVFVRFAEFVDCRFADDPHVLLGYQTGNHCARGFDHTPIPDRHPNQRERQWGVSPRDRQAVLTAMLKYRPLVTLQDLQQGAYFRGMRQFGFGQYINNIPMAA